MSETCSVISFECAEGAAGGGLRGWGFSFGVGQGHVPGEVESYERARQPIGHLGNVIHRKVVGNYGAWPLSTNQTVKSRLLGSERRTTAKGFFQVLDSGKDRNW